MNFCLITCFESIESYIFIPMKNDMLTKILRKHREKFAAVTPFDLSRKKLCYLDLSDQNNTLSVEKIADNKTFSLYIKDFIERQNADIAIGKYNEDRTIYRKSKHFTPQGEEPRSIHLGADLWLAEATPISAPIQGKVHSFQVNDNYGDYGPTIILEHILENTVFYTLYGHLSSKSLNNIHPGQKIEKGEQFCSLGNPSENGQWPVHLHFQIIADMMGKSGDFPGVAKISEREKFLEISPDPGLILGIKTCD